jgi:RHS repeat-associated protein
VNYVYDGALPKAVTWSGAVQGSVGFAYDSNFRVSKLTVNGTDSVAFGYDKDNLITSAGAMTLVRDSLNGRLLRTRLGNDTSSWIYDDSTGAITHYAAAHGSTTLFDVEYSRDSLNRITQLDETVEGVTAVKTFRYDSLGRLDQVRLNGAIVSTYGYDTNGNRTSLSNPSGMVIGGYDDQDRLLSYGGASFTYTANGELETKTVANDTTRYTYDVLGNLTKVRQPNGTTVEYVVDAQNRRIGKKINGVLVRGFLYVDQLAPVAELDANGSVISRFVFATQATVPDFIVRDTAVFRVVTDHLGSVRLVVNVSTGSVVQRIDYDEFGRVVQNTNPGFQPFGFAGGLYDEGTGLVRFGARDYDSQLARWTAKDPVGFSSGATNLYSYVGGDPINERDPTGLWPEEPLSLGSGWTARVDYFNESGIAKYEIHVANGGVDVGILGPKGWIGRHSFEAGVQPNMPREIANRLNGLNVSEARRFGFLGRAGSSKPFFSRDFAGFARGVRSAGIALSILDILSAAARAISCGRSLLDQLLIDYGLRVDPQTARELLMT